jgi:FHA domain-containing protein
MSAMDVIVLSYNGEPLQQPLLQRLATHRLRIGRGEGNDLVLDDPERIVSRNQAQLVQEGNGTAKIINTSPRSTFFVNGSEVMPGTSWPLHASDQILIGRYLLMLHEATEQREVTHNDAPPQVLPHQDTQAVSERLAKANGVSATPGTTEPHQPHFIPEDFDVFAVPPRSSSAGGLDDLVSDVSLDDFRGEKETTREIFSGLTAIKGETLPEPDEHRHQTILKVGAGDYLDPLKMFDAPNVIESIGLPLDHGMVADTLMSLPSTVEASSFALSSTQIHEQTVEIAPADSSGIQSQQQPPPDLSSMESREPMQRVDTAVSVNEDGYINNTRAPQLEQSTPSNPPQVIQEAELALVQHPNVTQTNAPLRTIKAAFAKGCGLPESTLPELTPDAMETLGRIMAVMTTGALRLIHGRSLTKHEMRANVTIIAAEGNNPLKFAPDCQAALTQLFGRVLPGFMEPVLAVEDAFNDLAAHQVGLLSGSRTAFYDAITRLEPERFREQLGESSVLDTMLPSARKARLWTIFEASYKNMVGGAREEFEALFQQAFSHAYEAEIERIHAAGGTR